jgi:hypothetical protein
MKEDRVQGAKGSRVQGMRKGVPVSEGSRVRDIRIESEGAE